MKIVLRVYNVFDVNSYLLVGIVECRVVPYGMLGWEGRCMLTSSMSGEPRRVNPCSLAKCNMQMKERCGVMSSFDVASGKDDKMFLKDKS